MKTVHETLGFGFSHARGAMPAERAPVRVRHGCRQVAWPPADPAPVVGGSRSLPFTRSGCFRSSAPYANVFVGLCDVDVHGRSTNVCDGLTGLCHAEDLACATVALTPTAYRFYVWGRARVQASTSAVPLYNCNLGAGEPRAPATHMPMVDQELHHSPDHPSAILLPERADR